MNADESFAPPRKALGQHFLHERTFIEAILGALDPHPNDIIVEIGPGRGALTQGLLNSKATVHVIEFDSNLAAYWQKQRRSHANLSVHQADVLRFDFADLATNQKLRVIGNLPYNISSPILFHLLQFIGHISDLCLMFQREVAERLVAKPGNKQYGRLSVMVQRLCSIQRLLKVPAGAFSPPPKIESSVVSLTPINPPTYPVDNEKVFANLVGQAFAQRRKTLKNALKTLISEQRIVALGIDPNLRAEHLPVASFVELANSIN